VLFGRRISVTREFLESSLQETGVKKAYRRMALETHPDRTGRSISAENGAITFLEVRDAYERLISFLSRQAIMSRTGDRDDVGGDESRRPGQTREDVYWIPERRLRIGEYLYFRKIVPLRALIDTVTRQQRSRPRLGEIAIERSMLSREELRSIVFGRKYPERIGEAALRLGFLTREEITSLVNSQRLAQRKIGSYFVDQGLIDVYHLFIYLNDLKKHNLRYSSDG